MDPYKVLELPKNFTLEQLRSNYKRIAVQVHPDKGGSDYLFKAVTLCYQKLKKEHELRKEDKPFYELREKAGEQRPRAAVPPRLQKGEKFNADRFNRMFEEHKIADDEPSTEGYASWMSKSDPRREDLDVKNNLGKFSLDKFNRAFENTPVSKDSRVLTRYRDPLPAQQVVAAELGVKKIDDFSGQDANGKLMFTDYKVAHTTTRLVDPGSVRPRKDFRSVEDLQASREKVRYTMNEKEKVLYEKARERDDNKEQARLHALRQRDEFIERQYQKLTQLLGS
jgi:curved DNA-binding protein CbpA